MGKVLLIIRGFMDQGAASVQALLCRRPELSGLIGSWAQDQDFQELCSDTLLLLGSIDRAGSRRAKLELLRLLHKLYAELDDYLSHESRAGS